MWDCLWWFCDRLVTEGDAIAHHGHFACSVVSGMFMTSGRGLQKSIENLEVAMGWMRTETSFC